ncbi:hypothetical protein FACS1894167_12920 [Synergistales bacterium]|nr:hypothetical protein FACS1894167_12920 [Synergistales bacterium]
MKKRIFIALFAIAALFALREDASAANKFDAAMARWVRAETYHNDMGGQFTVRATLYTKDYIESLMESEAEKNLWTASELEDYKYNFLKELKLEDNVAIYLELEENGPTAHMAPFNEMVDLWIGNKKYGASDFDPRFNMPLLGKRDGMVYFPRFDEKTGESLFKKKLTLRFEMNPAASPVLDNRSVRILWDVNPENIGAPGSGTAANRIEVDRLIRRMERLNGERADLEAQLDAKKREIDEVRSRIEDIQGK